MPSIVAPIPPSELAGLPTRQLLALRDRLLACEESLARSDAMPHELGTETIRFKDDPRWTVLHDAVKAVLATREHVPRPSERRAARRRRARQR